MSGLQSFVKGNQQQQMRHDRSQAHILKIGLGAAKSAHKSASAVPSSASTTATNRFAPRMSFDAQKQDFKDDHYQAPTQEPPDASQYHGHAQKSARGLGDDETISSDFEKTVTGSELQDDQQYVEDEHEYGHDDDDHRGFQQVEQGQQRYDYGHNVNYEQQTPHYERGEEELQRLSQEQPDASRTVVQSTRSRFTQSQAAPQHSALPNRVNASKEYDSRSRKRTRSAENQQLDEPHQHGSTGQLGDDQSELDESSQGSPVPIEKQAGGSRRAHHSQQYDEFLSQTSYEHSPDYDDAQLKAKQYSDLANESREYDPGHKKKLVLPHDLQGPQISLSDKVDYYVQNYAARQTERDARSDETKLFFAQLSTKEWDEAGDIFVDKFADLMKQIKAKRTEKRQAMDNFEKEIEKRERAVRGKSENLDRKLEAMRTSGEQVLGGKKD